MHFIAFLMQFQTFRLLTSRQVYVAYDNACICMKVIEKYDLFYNCLVLLINNNVEYWLIDLLQASLHFSFVYNVKSQVC